MVLFQGKILSLVIIQNTKLSLDGGKAGLSMLRADSVRDGHHNLKKGRDGLAAGNISI